MVLGEELKRSLKKISGSDGILTGSFEILDGDITTY